MPVVNCPECGGKVATTAATCPHCGAPRAQAAPPIVRTRPATSPVTAGCAVILGFAALLGVAAMMSSGSKSGPSVPVPAASARPAYANDPKSNAEREKLLAKMVSEGIFRRYEHRASGVTHVYVGPEFIGLDVELKKKFLSVVMADAYVKSSKADLVVIDDYRTGNKIGSFSPDLGLSME